MGIETFLILVGLIGESATDKGTKAYNAFDTALTVGLYILCIEAAFLVLFLIAAFVGALLTSKRGW